MLCVLKANFPLKRILLALRAVRDHHLRQIVL